MKNNITELVFILDRSGSMAGLESDTVGGFNSMIEKQRRQDGVCYVSTILFNDKSEVLHDRAKLSDIPRMSDNDYTVRGNTALIDALGDAILHIGNIHKYARAEDIPEHTVFVITTDGQENASHRYTRAQVKRMIECRKEEYGWEFLFIGANIDAVETAADLGGQDFFGQSAFAFFEQFADADDRFQTGGDSGFEAAVDGGIGFAEVLAAFAVTDDDIFDTGGFEHIGRNFSGECAIGSPVDVLRTDFDTAAFGSFDDGTDGGERRADDDIDLIIAAAGKFSLEGFDQFAAFGSGFVHFPVTGDDYFTAHFQFP